MQAQKAIYRAEVSVNVILDWMPALNLCHVQLTLLMNTTTQAPLMQRSNALGEIYLTAHADADRNLICEWRGFVVPDQIKETSLELLELQVRHNIYHVLNDLTHVTGTWSQAIPWLANEFQQLLRQRVPKSHGAIVLGRSVFSNLSAKQMVGALPQEENYRIELFSNHESALAWLRGL